ncbi:MAG: site-2 protease family protein [Saprospiraceae bacterium]
MIEQAIRVGTFANIPLRIHWTFVFIIIYIIGTGLNDGNSYSEIIIQVCFTLSMFVCVVLHEFGHALTAKRYGIKTEDIILLPIGGVARLERFPEKAQQELIIAIMGPLVNLVIAMTLFIGLFIYHGEHFAELFDPSTFLNLSWVGFLPLLLIANILLMVFNMIPAFPMDGGRVLRALISMKTNRLVATKWATRIGQFICFIFIGLGYYYNAWTTVFIGIFIFFSANSEYKHVVKEFALKNKTIGQFLRNISNCFTDYQKLSDVKEIVIQSGINNFPVIDITGQYIGSVNASEIFKKIKSNTSLTIKDVMNDEVITLDKNESLTMGVHYLENVSPLIYVQESHNIIGILDQDSVNRGLQLGI